MPLPGPPPRDIKDPRYEPTFVNVDPLLKEAIASAQLAGAVHAKHDALTKAKEDNTPSMAGLKNGSDAQPDSANTDKRKPSEENILDFTVEQVRDNPAWALAVFRHQMKQKSIDNIGYINQIGGLQEENDRLEAEVKSLRMGSDGYNIGLWRKDYIHKSWQEMKKWPNYLFVQDKQLHECITVLIKENARHEKDCRYLLTTGNIMAETLKKFTCNANVSVEEIQSVVDNWEDIVECVKR